MPTCIDCGETIIPLEPENADAQKYNELQQYRRRCDACAEQAMVARQETAAYKSAMKDRF